MKIRSPYFKKEYDLGKAQLIGEGNFAQVFRIFDSDLNDSLAIRKVKKTETDMEDITKEKIINEELRKVQNQNILKIYDIIDTQQAVWYITEFCSGGSLWDVLNLCKDNKMNEKDCLLCVLQISKGVQQLHNHRITHRDLKPQNILLKTKYIQNKQLPLVKLADFGLSTQKIIMQTIAGTKQYIAPEQAKFHNYTNAVDVWSLGIICDQILHGTPFYSGQNNKQVFNKILKLPYRVRDQSIRESIKNLLTSLLKKKPYERPIIAVIRKTIQKILEQIEAETLALKNEKPKKKDSKDQSFQSSTHSSNLNKYSNMLGLDSRKVEPKKVINQIKQASKDKKQIKQVKSSQAIETNSKPKKDLYVAPSFASSNALKNNKDEIKKQEPKKVTELKRQISGKKPQPVVYQKPKQRSLIKSKLSKQSQSITDQQTLGGKENIKQIETKISYDQKSQQITGEDTQSKTTESSFLTKNIENFQIPIYKLEKKKITIPQPKKDTNKSDFMDVNNYVSKLIESKKQLQQSTSQIKAQKIPSFLPNTFLTSQQFTVTTSQTTQCITQFKKNYDILNFIQYNDEHDGNLYRKFMQLSKNKRKCSQNMKKVSEKLKSEFLKQVDNYVESYLEKLLK